MYWNVVSFYPHSSVYGIGSCGIWCPRILAKLMPVILINYWWCGRESAKLLLIHQLRKQEHTLNPSLRTENRIFATYFGIKADCLNNYFASVFTKENLSTFPPASANLTAVYECLLFEFHLMESEVTKMSSYLEIHWPRWHLTQKPEGKSLMFWHYLQPISSVWWSTQWLARSKHIGSSQERGLHCS